MQLPAQRGDAIRVAAEECGALRLWPWLASNPGGQEQMAAQCGIVSVIPGIDLVRPKARFRLATALAKGTADIALVYLRAAAASGGGERYEPKGPPRVM